MSLFRRIFSADYRAAVSAEASGELDVAAERYALAGHPDAAARVHLARARRSETFADQINALRDVLHWVRDDDDMRVEAARELGSTLLDKAVAEGIGTERDRKRVEEAARCLESCGDWLRAGQAWELVGKDERASGAYSKGGHVEKLEALLAREGDESAKERELIQAYADYELHEKSADREAAKRTLRTCIELATGHHEARYRELLDQLESRMITNGRVTLRPRGGQAIVITTTTPVELGRDPLCDFQLRAAGVSRRHARIDRRDRDFCLADLGSKNGTRVAGMPISNELRLQDRGEFRLGDHCALTFEEYADQQMLVVDIARGLDAGTTLIIGDPSGSFSLGSIKDLQLVLKFREGRPFLHVDSDSEYTRLNGEPAEHGVNQLIRGDLITVGDSDVEIQ